MKTHKHLANLHLRRSAIRAPRKNTTPSICIYIYIAAKNCLAAKYETTLLCHVGQNVFCRFAPSFLRLESAVSISAHRAIISAILFYRICYTTKRESSHKTTNLVILLCVCVCVHCNHCLPDTFHTTRSSSRGLANTIIKQPGRSVSRPSHDNIYNIHINTLKNHITNPEAEAAAAAAAGSIRYIHFVDTQQAIEHRAKQTSCTIHSSTVGFPDTDQTSSPDPPTNLHIYSFGTRSCDARGVGSAE